MIKQKKKICKECLTEQFIFSKGLCKFCASKSFKQIQPTSIKYKAKPKVNKDELNKFFEKHITILSQNPISTESGEFISTPSRLNIGHLLPKRNHKSVETNDLNVAYLTWQEHSDFDRMLDSHKFEEIEKRFPKTWILLKKVLPLVQERTKLIIALENYINGTKFTDTITV